MAHGDITHIDIPVSDLTQATAFYSDLFGWKLAETPGFEGYPMWSAPNGVSGGGLAPRSDGFTQPRSYVEVDSIDDTVAKAGARSALLRGRGAHVEGGVQAPEAGPRRGGAFRGMLGAADGATYVNVFQKPPPTR